MSYLPDLRRSLVRAAERQIHHRPDGPEPATASPGGRRARRRGPWAWPRVGLRAVATLLVVLVPIAVAVAALTGLGRGTSPPRPSSIPAVSLRSVPVDLRGLYEALGVLRRPQTKADLDSAQLRQFLAHSSGAGMTPVLSMIRRATGIPGGGAVFLVPEQPARGVGPRVVQPSLRRRAGKRPLLIGAPRRSAGLATVGGGGAGCCSTATEIKRTGDLFLTGDQMPGGGARSHFFVVVPDGVARVAFIVPSSRSYTAAGAVIHRRGLTLMAAVHGNVAAAQIARECCDQVPMIWYGSTGRVIKRIGNPAALGRQPSLPVPGPVTARSRAAELNPATPNPVRVTPAVGGPRTSFTASWINLLNFAGYRLQSSGPTGRNCRGANDLPGALGGEPPGSDLRGHVYRQPLHVGLDRNPWCPGTYHVSIAVTHLTTTARPFGTATFTVR